MKASPLAVAVTIMAASANIVSASSARERNAFSKAMQQSHQSRNLAQNELPPIKSLVEAMTGDSSRARNLRKKVMEKAKPLSVASASSEKQRQLQSSSTSASSSSSGTTTTTTTTTTADGADDYFVAYGEWSNTFGFNPTQYSLSYSRCAAIRQFDDELAAEEDSTTVFSTKNFAVFRFCPSKTCEGTSSAVQYLNQQAAQEAAAQQQASSYSSSSSSSSQQATQQTEYEEPAIFEKLLTGGANGEGCQSNYGEYMLELEDYLAIMVEYHQERFETYCDTCKTCMYNVYSVWMKNGGGRKLKDMSDLSWKDDLESEEFTKAHRELGYNPYNTCPEYDTCRLYQNVCSSELDDSLTQYFTCTEIQRNNNNNNNNNSNNVAYIGPHCASDGVTVTLGVYADENCNEYIGKGVNIANFLGYELEGDELGPYVTGSLIDVIPEKGVQSERERFASLYDPEEMAEYYSPVDNVCIPCMAARQPFEVSGNTGFVEGVYDDEVTELCETLYTMSARCDKHFRSFSTKSTQAKYAQALSQEDITCDFIESVVIGNYDEMGFVNMQGTATDTAKSNFLTNNMMWEQYGSQVQEVSGLQVFGLVAALAACAVLGTWAGSLSRSAGTGMPWRPRRANLLSDEDAVTMERNAKPVDLTDRNHSYYLS